MARVIDWIIENTEAGKVCWMGPLKKGLEDDWGISFKANIVGTDKPFKNAYVYVRGPKRELCILFVDEKNKKHIVKAKNRTNGKTIKDTFQSFFNRKYLDKSHKTKKSFKLLTKKRKNFLSLQKTK